MMYTLIVFIYKNDVMSLALKMFGSGLTNFAAAYNYNLHWKASFQYIVYRFLRSNHSMIYDHGQYWAGSVFKVIFIRQAQYNHM